jgi:hypothetical protein
MPQSILPADNTLHLNHRIWGLAHARGTAAEILANSDLLKPLVRALLGPDPILRRHAADTARRITEKQPESRRRARGAMENFSLSSPNLGISVNGPAQLQKRRSRRSASTTDRACCARWKPGHE